MDLRPKLVGIPLYNSKYSSLKNSQMALESHSRLLRRGERTGVAIIVAECILMSARCEQQRSKGLDALECPNGVWRRMSPFILEPTLRALRGFRALRGNSDEKLGASSVPPATPDWTVNMFY